eukprot:CAMPEP_0114273262 /NCGR_PEP_ID=MMETSP0058-20121206/28997_1 /TAXON_ID=36894 /ORGANISM="Pyramimonas parkeae, CCMP726" /LENGTH=262 /DNA_ID=CAMNT_0001392693 /DNA_START=219 /DNA_END=1007 /DNA_ORIENTATION=-
MSTQIPSTVCGVPASSSVVYGYTPTGNSHPINLNPPHGYPTDPYYGNPTNPYANTMDPYGAPRAGPPASAAPSSEPTIGIPADPVYQDEGIYLPLVPGLGVISYFADPQVNEICRRIFRTALVIFVLEFMQLVRGVAMESHESGFGIHLIAPIVLSMCFDLFVLWLGVRAVKLRNSEFDCCACCRCTHLGMYRVVLYILLFFSMLNVIAVVPLVAEEGVTALPAMILAILGMVLLLTNLNLISRLLQLLPAASTVSVEPYSG